MDRDLLTLFAAVSVRELFLCALEGSDDAVRALLDRSAEDPAAAAASSAIVISDCDRCEHEGQLEEPSVASVDQILAAVRDAAADHHRA